MRAFWLAIQFLTRLPTPRQKEFGPEDRGRSVLYYPVVGLILGALLVAVAYVLADAEPGIQAALILIVWVLLSGGLHLDGLADSADAWAGSHGDRERALAIMKDPRSGPAAIMIVTLILILKFAALSALAQEAVWQALVVAPLLGRATLVLLFLSAPYVRTGGIGAEHAAHLPRVAALLVLVVVAALVPMLIGWPGLWILVAVSTIIFLLRQMMLKILGGITGDTLGAACEIVETVVLTTMAFMIV